MSTPIIPTLLIPPLDSPSPVGRRGRPRKPVHPRSTVELLAEELNAVLGQAAAVRRNMQVERARTIALIEGVQNPELRIQLLKQLADIYATLVQGAERVAKSLQAFEKGEGGRDHPGGLKLEDL